MKKVLLVLFLMVSIVSFSQKIKLKDRVVYVDDAAWLKYQDCGGFDPTCSLLNKDGEELVFFKWIRVPGAEPITNYNRNGELSYVEIVFVGQKMKIELQKTQKGVIEILYNAKIVNEDGTLNPEKVDRLVEKYGTPFSDRLNKSNNPNTIIINNNQEPTRGSGVNINIGK